ncbi:hypothetical protein WDW37_05430 [Bdellovibrionota bacterium FG-1]
MMTINRTWITLSLVGATLASFSQLTWADHRGGGGPIRVPAPSPISRPLPVSRPHPTSPAPSGGGFHPPMGPTAPGYTPHSTYTPPAFTPPPVIVHHNPPVQPPPVVVERVPRPNGGVVVRRGHSSYGYGQHGERTVYVGGQRHFSEERVVAADRAHMRRTYFEGGREVEVIYPGRQMGNEWIFASPHRHRFTPLYYGWLFRSWDQPICGYHWGWENEAWADHYGRYYFRPHTECYMRPSMWLTDWMFAEVLREEYLERQMDVVDRSERVLVTRDIRDQITRQIDVSMIAHQNDQPIYFTDAQGDPRHLFIVDGVPEVFYPSSYDNCTVSGGDIVRLVAPVFFGQTAQVEVVAAQYGSCRPGTILTMLVRDLQESENEFNRRVELGMLQMRENVMLNSRY